MLDISNIEQAIKDAINGLARPYIVEVATYGGEFDDDLSKVIRRFPAVWVTFSGGNSRPVGTSKRKWHLYLTFAVLVGARSIRNEQASRHGIAVGGQQIEYGTFQLLNDVQIALLGKDLGLAINPFEMGRITTLFNTRVQNNALSVLAQEWKTSLVVRVSDDDDSDAVPWLLSLGMDYHYPPNNETPVATDTINFQV